MILIRPYRTFIDRSPAWRRVVLSVSSETWSLLGLVCTICAAGAGHFHFATAYSVLLVLQIICDTNDGYVYQERENGIVNGYGLYLDHILDGVAAALAAYGGYAIVGHPLACAVGLTLYYLIAIHSWLYKIAQLARGQIYGLYYAVTLSKRRRLLLNVDDLAVFMVALVLTDWIPLLYIIDGVLLLVFVRKVIRAAMELRATMWLHPEAAADLHVATGSK
jgi:hypothetical protein